jgi:outer membrane receptor protein involved in Fe transport
MRVFISLLSCLIGLQTAAQTSPITIQSIRGVLQSNSGSALSGTIQCDNIVVDTDAEGVYEISALKVGTYTLTARSGGTFSSSTSIVSLAAGEQKVVNFQLAEQKRELEMLTVSGSRFKKRGAEEVVSIEIIKPDFVRKAAINRLDEALNKLPGVDVVDNQVNIRGGSGWSYGAGSRVLVMVDDMPMLTADANDAKWDFLPIENCDQIEVMKGAASALYGSSALNGVVNFRTAFAGKKPVTKIQLLSGIFGNPARKEMAWWDRQQPSFHGGYLSHSQRFGKLEAVVGGAWYSEDSYLQGDVTRRIRLNSNLRYKVNQRVTIGINTNAQISKSSTFFLHTADTSFANLLQPFGGLADSTTTISKNAGGRFNIDPYLTYASKKGWQHNIRTRIFFAQNIVANKAQSSTSYTSYSEYQAMKKTDNNANSPMLRNTNFIAGIVGTFGFVQGDLYGNHTYRNFAPYTQVEKKIGAVWVVGGMRFENNWMQETGAERRPVFRAGLNYEPRFGTNIRASWGQGYRYPSVAEKFISTNFGAASVFPNPTLLSETGWSAELGIKQGVNAGKWMGYADVAMFLMRYKNMMEFNFGYAPPIDSPTVVNPIDYIGFQSRNIGDAQIYGIDLTTMLRYSGSKMTHNIIAGYTYVNPTSINPDSVVKANLSTDRNILKYRFLHTIKGNWDAQLGKWNLGCLNTINSPMVNIDEVFEFNDVNKNVFGLYFQAGTNLPSTIRTYRNQYNKWLWTCDVRVGYQVSKEIRVALVVKNVTNTEYYIRPALINPPRNFTVQINAEL